MEIRNNVQSPNFGMSLRISKTPEMAAKLKELPMSVINRLKAAGKILGKEGEENSTKFYHVRVDNDLKCSLEADKDAYFGLFKTEKYNTHNGTERDRGVDVVSDRIIIIEHGNGNPFAGVARYVPYGQTEPFFSVWGACGAYGHILDVERMANIAKILDEVAAEKHYTSIMKETTETIEKTDVSKAVDSFLDTYGI